MIPCNPKVCLFIGGFLMMGSVGAIEHNTMELGQALIFSFIGTTLALDGAIRLNRNSDV